MLRELGGGDSVSPEQLSPLVLAYVGDAVYELYVRCQLVERGPTRVHQLHQEAVRLVRATSQARFLSRIEAELTEEETGIMKRGRNAHSGPPPRGTETVEYRLSTGLESLIGFLYLRGDLRRIEEILSRLPWPRQERDKTAG